TGRKVFESEAHRVVVLPIPAPPPDHSDAAWLPARDVRLEEEWSRPPGEMGAGEPVTRVVSLSALGQIETQLPAPEAPDVDGLNIYADKPELGRVLESGGIRGVRRDEYAIIGLAAGEPELPAISVPWWDVEAGAWKVASLPARTLTVAGAERQVTSPPPVSGNPVEAAGRDAGVQSDSASAAGSEAVVAVNAFWQRAAELLGVLWLLTVAAWWWSSRSAPRRGRTTRAPKEPPVHKQQTRLLKTARSAAAAGDGAGVRRAMLEWGRLQWPQGAPRSIGELAGRVEVPLSDELRKLSAASYGPQGGTFDGDVLARALKSVKVVAAFGDRDIAGILPPLMPTDVKTSGPLA
ncbi:MAG: hypothetical protein MJA32_10225, partial [Proteobacteria bacterium]|nr:hypothetical protein [Pseudomonadota bacterium]